MRHPVGTEGNGGLWRRHGHGGKARRGGVSPAAGRDAVREDAVMSRLMRQEQGINGIRKAR